MLAAAIVIIVLSFLVVIACIPIIVINLRRADRNLDRVAKHRESIAAFRRATNCYHLGDVSGGERWKTEAHRIKTEADAMPVYDAWRPWRLGREGQ